VSIGAIVVVACGLMYWSLVGGGRVIKSTDTGTVWMWENICRIAGSASLERFSGDVCLKVKMEVEESSSSKQSWLQAKRNVTVTANQWGSSSSGDKGNADSQKHQGPRATWRKTYKLASNRLIDTEALGFHGLSGRLGRLTRYENQTSLEF